MQTTKATMGRGRGRLPDPQRTAQTRQLILQSALATFLQRGFEGTRMADVAAGAGLAKGTLYLHFADKEALFEFVLQQMVSEPLARFRAEPPPPGESARGRLERLLLPLLRDFESSGRATVMRLIIAEGCRFPALAAIHRRLVIEPITQLVQETAAGAVGAGEDRLAPLARFPQLVGAPVVMTAVWNGLWGADRPLDPAAMFTAFLDLVFGPSVLHPLPPGEGRGEGGEAGSRRITLTQPSPGGRGP
jgi:AcrR family transcriptional regulator